MHVNLPDKRYYSIGELAKAFEVNPSLIRFWEKEFDILQPKKMLRATENLLQKTSKICLRFIISWKNADLP